MTWKLKLLDVAITKLSTFRLRNPFKKDCDYLKHEALDRVHVVAFLFEEQIATHPAIMQVDEWEEKANQIVRQMDELYNMINKDNLG